MKILEINKFFSARRGAERHFLDLITLLEKHGQEVAVFSMRHPENMPSPWEKYFVSHVGYNSDDSTLCERIMGTGRLFWSFEARRNMKAIINDFRPELVHVHNAYHQLSLSFFPIIKKAGIPLVMTVHDYVMISPDKDTYYPEVGRQYWKFLLVQKYSIGKRLLLIVKKYWEESCGFYDNVDHFIIPSRYVKNIFLSAGVSEEKMTVLPHFIPESDEGSGENRERKLPKEYLFSFGAISKEKGIDTLLQISASTHIPLVLAGRIEGDFDVEKYPNVIYLGMQNRFELNGLIKNAAAVVSASELPETFGLTALETVSLGKPFFALDRGALSEIITNGENGFLAKDRAELETIINRFLSGEIRVATPEILRNTASERFGARTYLGQFQPLSESLTRKS